MSRTCLIRMISSDQCIAIAPSQSARSVVYTSWRPSTIWALVFLSSERKHRISRAILPITLKVPVGFSSRWGLIQLSAFCCPQVVGMRKGTGTLAQVQTL